jgi:hypothetical protein
MVVPLLLLTIFVVDIGSSILYQNQPTTNDNEQTTNTNQRSMNNGQSDNINTIN